MLGLVIETEQLISLEQTTSLLVSPQALCPSWPCGLGSRGHTGHFVAGTGTTESLTSIKEPQSQTDAFSLQSLW